MLIEELQKYIQENEELQEVKKAAFEALRESKEKYTNLEIEKELNEEALVEEYKKLEARLEALSSGAERAGGSQDLDMGLQMQINILQSENEKLEEKYFEEKSKLEKEIGELKDEFGVMEQNYERQLRILNETVAKLEEDASKKHQSEVALIKSITSLMDNEPLLVEKISSLEEYVHELETAKGTMEKELIKLRSDFEAKREESLNISEAYAGVKKDHENCLKIQKGLERENASLHKEGMRRGAEYEHEISELKVSLKSTKENLEKMQDEFRREKMKLVKENTKLRKKVTKRENKILELDEQVKEYEEEIDELQDELDNMKEIKSSRRNHHEEGEEGLDHMGFTSLGDEMSGKENGELNPYEIPHFPQNGVSKLRFGDGPVRSKISVEEMVKLAEGTGQMNRVMELEKTMQLMKEMEVKKEKELKEEIAKAKEEAQKLREMLMKAATKNEENGVLSAANELGMLKAKLKATEDKAKSDVANAGKEIAFLKKEMEYFQIELIHAKIREASALTREGELKAKMKS